MNKAVFASFITEHVNYGIAYGEFPDELKHAANIPVHKKNGKDKLQTSKHCDQHSKNLWEINV